MTIHRLPRITTSLNINTSVEGETIEQKIERIISAKEPIKDGAPIIFTERKDGVNPSHNVRTDRFEVAALAADKVAKSYKAKREDRINKATGKSEKKDGEAESIQGKPEGTAETVK